MTVPEQENLREVPQLGTAQLKLTIFSIMLYYKVYRNDNKKRSTLVGSGSSRVPLHWPCAFDKRGQRVRRIGFQTSVSPIDSLVKRLIVLHLKTSSRNFRATWKFLIDATK